MADRYKLTLTAEEYADLLSAQGGKAARLAEQGDAYELSGDTRRAELVRKLAERNRALYVKLQQTRPYNS